MDCFFIKERRRNESTPTLIRTAGVGPKSAEKFKKLGIETLEDLLLYFPFRYEDFKTRNVLELEDGEKAVISGAVATPANVQYYGYKRNRLRFSIKQGDQVIAVNFFNQPYLADKIEVQQTVAIFGKWDKAKGSLTGMKLLAQVEDDLQPVYRVTQGVSQNSLVKLIKIAFDQGLDQLLEENVWTPFPQFQHTERPDKAASGLLEGRIVLVVDNSPGVLILPVTYQMFFQAGDDYYTRFEVASFARLLRFAASLFAIRISGIVCCHSSISYRNAPNLLFVIHCNSTNWHRHSSCFRSFAYGISV